MVLFLHKIGDLHPPTLWLECPPLKLVDTSAGPMLHRETLILLLTASIVVLSGCVTPISQGLKDAHQRQVLTRIDACLKQQQETNRKLSVQIEQMVDQQTQIRNLSDQLSTMGVTDGEATSTSAKKSVRCNSSSSDNKDNKLLIGSMEKMWLPDLGLALPARVDTGAETASLDARNIKVFERNGRRWVRFEIMNPTTDEPILLERKLKRTVLIFQANSTEPDRRRVVKMSVTIGHINQTAEFTLSDRSHLDHQALIGRNIMQDVMIVDVSKKNIAPFVANRNNEAK
jgi:hypothetical protein